LRKVIAINIESKLFWDERESYKVELNRRANEFKVKINSLKFLVDCYSSPVLMTILPRDKLGKKE
jgi:hypothetical protein